VLTAFAPVIAGGMEPKADKTVLIKNLGVDLPRMTKFALSDRNDDFGSRTIAGGYIMSHEKTGNEVKFKLYKSRSLAPWNEGGEYFLWVYTDFPYMSLDAKENPDIVKDKPSFLSRVKYDFSGNTIIIDWKDFREPEW